MIITISSSVIFGYSGIPIKIELDVSRGFPKFLFVGLADTMIKEAKERVRVVLESQMTYIRPILTEATTLFRCMKIILTSKEPWIF